MNHRHYISCFWSQIILLYKSEHFHLQVTLRINQFKWKNKCIGSLNWKGWSIRYDCVRELKWHHWLSDSFTSLCGFGSFSVTAGGLPTDPRACHPSLITSGKGGLIPSNPHCPFPTIVLTSFPSRTLIVPDWAKCPLWRLRGKDLLLQNNNNNNNKNRAKHRLWEDKNSSGQWLPHRFDSYSCHRLTFNCSQNLPWELVRDADSRDPSEPYWVRAADEPQVSLMYMDIWEQLG